MTDLEEGLSDNGRVAKALVESLGQLGTGATAKLLSAEAEFICRAKSETIPLKRRQSGRDFCEILQPRMHEIFPNGVRHDVISVIESGNRVIVESECDGVTAEGRRYNNYFAFIITLRDGLVTEIREYADFLHTYEVVFKEIC